LPRPSWRHGRVVLRLPAPLRPGRAEPSRRTCPLFPPDLSRSDRPRLAGLDACLRKVPADKKGGQSTVKVPDLLDRLVELRNKDTGHGAVLMRNAEFYERTGPALLAGALELLGQCDVLAGRRLTFLDDVRRLGSGDWLVEWSLLVGEAPWRQESLTVPEADTARLPRPGRVYLHRTGPHGDAWRELHPLLLFDPGSYRAFFLNS